ncbi:hypothetical protein HMPREF3227_02741 [Corynebacterium sp. CMW7794]|nr:hypothetical protein HMPREF3227_02741 [Corynebacterium sp. CMW7794]
MAAQRARESVTFIFVGNQWQRGNDYLGIARWSRGGKLWG